MSMRRIIRLIRKMRAWKHEMDAASRAKDYKKAKVLRNKLDRMEPLVEKLQEKTLGPLNVNPTEADKQYFGEWMHEGLKKAEHKAKADAARLMKKQADIKKKAKKK